MKKIISILLVTFFICSCEDKVDVDLDTASPKLVIDANIFWKKGTSGITQKIKLTKTTSYYSSTIPAATGATVTITNANNEVFIFTEAQNSGEYICDYFEPIINQNYTLSIIYEGQTYSATEKLLATPDIIDRQQTTVQGFSGEEIQFKYFYQDNGNENNFYLLTVKNSNKTLPEYGVLSDEFFQGNTMFGFYTEDNEKLNSGTILQYSVAGISERYYNYMNKLINIAGSAGGSPFATPPATLRGNIINQSNQDNYPLGYFHLSEIDVETYTVQ